MLMRRGPFSAWSRRDLINEVLDLRAKARAGRTLAQDLEVIASVASTQDHDPALIGGAVIVAATEHLVRQLPPSAASAADLLMDEDAQWPGQTVVSSRHEMELAHLDNDRLREQLGNALARVRQLEAQQEAPRSVGDWP